ncbi:hypothetical protein TREMEDRAFT_66274 [Tremella mesenterica DSM 1558]|uniref:uncharacterized protein n=1 Tax=Tremella mesenterica (strain ATCC 24925 / CBS 8224 / DSM 1558 / NBRC 9311 / NRRL Y-6157 / RJB 2259-6 / UBC 559-6) TaxID=578456 RepID=UPI00032C19AA|nr:uncharacterized protein TREMEDRAFT_66274 [Tremella mesenterica DSM 1558]EIW65680.1 hypothetical protein TREMEDRAFT_66274 [Tremella mesenterica DSM 1558]
MNDQVSYDDHWNSLDDDNDNNHDDDFTPPSYPHRYEHTPPTSSPSTILVTPHSLIPPDPSLSLIPNSFASYIEFNRTFPSSWPITSLDDICDMLRAAHRVSRLAEEKLINALIVLEMKRFISVKDVDVEVTAMTDADLHRWRCGGGGGGGGGGVGQGHDDEELQGGVEWGQTAIQRNIRKLRYDHGSLVRKETQNQPLDPTPSTPSVSALTTATSRRTESIHNGFDKPDFIYFGQSKRNLTSSSIPINLNPLPRSGPFTPLASNSTGLSGLDYDPSLPSKSTSVIPSSGSPSRTSSQVIESEVKGKGKKKRKGKSGSSIRSLENVDPFIPTKPKTDDDSPSSNKEKADDPPKGKKTKSKTHHSDNLHIISIVGERKDDPRYILEGLPQTIVHLKSAFQAFGTYMAFYMYQGTYMRMMMLDQGVLVIESNQTIRRVVSDHLGLPNLKPHAENLETDRRYTQSDHDMLNQQNQSDNDTLEQQDQSQCDDHYDQNNDNDNYNSRGILTLKLSTLLALPPHILIQMFPHSIHLEDYTPSQDGAQPLWDLLGHAMTVVLGHGVECGRIQVPRAWRGLVSGWTATAAQAVDAMPTPTLGGAVDGVERVDDVSRVDATDRDRRDELHDDSVVGTSRGTGGASTGGRGWTDTALQTKVDDEQDQFLAAALFPKVEKGLKRKIDGDTTAGSGGDPGGAGAGGDAGAGTSGDGGRQEDGTRRDGTRQDPFNDNLDFYDIDVQRSGYPSDHVESTGSLPHQDHMDDQEDNEENRNDHEEDDGDSFVDDEMSMSDYSTSSSSSSSDHDQGPDDGGGGGVISDDTPEMKWQDAHTEWCRPMGEQLTSLYLPPTEHHQYLIDSLTPPLSKHTKVLMLDVWQYDTLLRVADKEVWDRVKGRFGSNLTSPSTSTSTSSTDLYHRDHLWDLLGSTDSGSNGSLGIKSGRG